MNIYDILLRGKKGKWRKRKMSKIKDEISFTQGSIVKALIRFMLPVLGALALQAAYGAVDLIVVGQFGDSSSISAVGTGSTFMHMLTVVITGLSMGGTIVIGQYIGRKKPKEAGDVVGTIIIFLAVVGVLLTIILEIFAGDILKLLKVPDKAFDQALDYTRICVAGTLVVIAYNVISGILRGMGNARLPLIFVGIASVVNIIGDLLLVGVFKLDAAGAAIATVFAQFISVIVSLAVLKKQNLPIVFSKSQLRVNKVILRQILNIGIPTALQDLMIQISFLVINAVINDMGLYQAAGYGVAQKIISFIMLIPSAIMQSVAAFVAQNIGAGNKPRAKKGMKMAITFGCSFGALIACMGIFFGDIMSMIFSTDAVVIEQSASYLRGFSIESVTTCILFSWIGYFNGQGKSMPVMIQGISSAFFIRIPVSILMSKITNTSLFYVGTAVPITTAYGLTFFIICFLLEKKKEKLSPSEN